jgi:hypothetical protein
VDEYRAGLKPIALRCCLLGCLGCWVHTVRTSTATTQCVLVAAVCYCRMLLPDAYAGTPANAVLLLLATV